MKDSVWIHDRFWSMWDKFKITTIQGFIRDPWQSYTSKWSMCIYAISMTDLHHEGFSRFHDRFPPDRDLFKIHSISLDYQNQIDSCWFILNLWYIYFTCILSAQTVKIPIDFQLEVGHHLFEIQHIIQAQQSWHGKWRAHDMGTFILSKN